MSMLVALIILANSLKTQLILPDQRVSCEIHMSFICMVESTVK